MKNEERYGGEMEKDEKPGDKDGDVEQIWKKKR